MTDPIKPQLRATRTEAVDACNVAHRLRLIAVYRKPFDWSIPIERVALTAELERAAAGADVEPILPADDDEQVYYLVYVEDRAEPVTPYPVYPVLLPERYAGWVMFGMGLADSLETAQELAPRRFVLPLDPPAPRP